MLTILSHIKLQEGTIDHVWNLVPNVSNLIWKKKNMLSLLCEIYWYMSGIQSNQIIQAEIERN